MVLLPSRPLASPTLAQDQGALAASSLEQCPAVPPGADVEIDQLHISEVRSPEMQHEAVEEGHSGAESADPAPPRGADQPPQLAPHPRSQTGPAWLPCVQQERVVQGPLFAPMQVEAMIDPAHGSSPHEL